MITLQNETLTAVLAERGAELQQLKNNHTGIDYLWNGDAAYWPKYSPLLFPTVGGLKDDTYYYNNKAYQLPRHGFGRERDFTAEQLSATEVLFSFKDDEISRAVYPFAFNIKLRYILTGSTLSCTYEVYNSGSDTLLFSIGAHPAFNVPLKKGLAYGDYYLEFNQPENLQRRKLKNGLIDPDTIPVPTPNNRLALQPSLFYEDAIVLKGLNSNCITLASEKDSHGLHFRFNDFPYFGIWAAKDAPFVCLEPWCGVGDNMHHDQQLATKEGINALEPGGRFERTWSVECF